MPIDTLLNDAKFAALADVLTHCRNVPGDLAELGVYRGGVAKLMAASSPDKIVHLFDTFAGIPADRHEAEDRHRPGEFACDLWEVQQALSGFANVSFHPGVFPSTAAGDRFSVVHLDGDLYRSTLDGLQFFWPRLSIGGAIVLDDWEWSFCPGVKRAVDEFFAGSTSHRFEVWAEHQLIVWKSSQS